MRKITIHIADDHQLIVDGFKVLFNRLDNIEVVKESKNGIDVIKWCQNNTTDILILDISMPDINGIDVLKYFKESNITQPTIMFSSHKGLQFINETIGNGAKGYVLKSDSESIVEAIETVYNNGVYYSESVKEFLIEEITENKCSTAYKLLNEVLSETEITIAKMFLNAKEPIEIAKRYNISESTVRTHLKNIRQKLNVNTNIGMVKKLSFLYK